MLSLVLAENIRCWPFSGADPGFQVRGGVLQKIVGVFRVKNHDFMPKNHIFSQF
jgi:hypothetical protein